MKKVLEILTATLLLVSFFVIGCNATFEGRIEVPNCEGCYPRDGDDKDPDGSDKNGSTWWVSLDLGDTGVDLDFDNGGLVSISIDHPDIQLFLPIGLFGGGISGIDGLDISVSTDSDKYIGTTDKLPNGKKLPNLSSRQLADYWILKDRDELSLHLYRRTSYLGLFIESEDLPSIPISVGFPIRRRNGQVIGQWWLIKEKDSHRGGVYILINNF